MRKGSIVGRTQERRALKRRSGDVYGIGNLKGCEDGKERQTGKEEEQ